VIYKKRVAAKAVSKAIPSLERQIEPVAQRHPKFAGVNVSYRRY